MHFQLAMEARQAWQEQEQEREHEGERLTLTPEDLGLRINYFRTGPVTDPVPDFDVAVPFRVERLVAPPLTTTTCRTVTRVTA